MFFLALVAAVAAMIATSVLYDFVFGSRAARAAGAGPDEGDGGSPEEGRRRAGLSAVDPSLVASS